MSLHLTLTAPFSDTFRVQQIVGMFDLPDGGGLPIEIDAELPRAGEPWTIGAIVGPSGSGKTSVARAAFGYMDRPPRWPKDRPVIDAFSPMPIRRLLALLAAVGFHSPPAWLRPYHLLSMGERFRCDLARRLGRFLNPLPSGEGGSRSEPGEGRAAERSAPGALTPAFSQRERNTLVIDEFTSHLDRDTARSVSYALGRFLCRSASAQVNQKPNQNVNQKVNQLDPENHAKTDVSACLPTRCGNSIRRANVNQKLNQDPKQNLNQTRCGTLRLVVVTCHDDILPWLAPDWVLRLPGGRLDRGPCATPPLPLRFERCCRTLWDHFRPHHYLSGNLARGATCYVARWEDRPAAFCAVLGQIGHAGRKRITRLVVLPQFQGLGIGMRLAESVCRREAKRGFRVSIATSHPAVIAACRRSPRWRPLGIKRLGGTPQTIRGRRLRGSTGRIVAAFEYRRTNDQ